jgi:hypothetical protein
VCGWQRLASPCHEPPRPGWISCTRRYEGSGLGLTEANSRVCGWSRGLGRGGSRTRGGEPGRGLKTKRAAGLEYLA